MGKIHLLSPEVSNKIAAGEVVENPSSVVKELIDNAIDARADQITIEIEEGGINKIKIIDNGSGMNAEDALLAFQRHATSKIASEDDILNIKTYGFRGEALSSIAAVSKLTIRTREQNAPMGTEIKIEGGQVISQEEIGTQAGTIITIESIFYNLPARREFLKSSQTEYRNILDIVEKYAIANHKIGFMFVNNGKVVYNFPKDHQLDDRVKHVVEQEDFSKLIPIYYEHPHIEIYGFIGKPELASERKKFQYIFVNRRAIENKSIAFAVKDAYSSLIPKNTYPAFVLFIDVPANIVDVNVHPRKEEVKFTNDKLIFSAVQDACKGALDRHNLTPGAKVAEEDIFGDAPGMDSPFAPRPAGMQRPPLRTPSFNDMPMPGSMPGSPMQRPTVPGQMPRSPFAPPALRDPSQRIPFDSGFDFFPQQSPKSASSSKKFFVAHNLYIFTQEPEGVAVYDQHALHERILYSRLKAQYEAAKEQKNIQPLAIPVVLNLPAKSDSILSDNINYLENLGFKIEEFGPSTYKITEIPAVFAEKDISTIVKNILTDLEEIPSEQHKDNFHEKILAYAACRGAYKAGDVIKDEEITQLLIDIKNADIEYTCPHGRPLKFLLTKDELEKKFLRK